MTISQALTYIAVLTVLILIFDITINKEYKHTNK